MEYGALMEMAVRAGEIMLASGAEVYRVEDTITRICKACRIDHVEIFATPTGIFVSLDDGDRGDDCGCITSAAYLGKKGGKPGNEFEPHLSGKQCFKGILQRKIVRRGGAGTTGSDC